MPSTPPDPASAEQCSSLLVLCNECCTTRARAQSLVGPPLRVILGRGLTAHMLLQSSRLVTSACADFAGWMHGFV